MENSTSGSHRWFELFQTIAGSCGERVRFLLYSFKNDNVSSWVFTSYDFDAFEHTHFNLMSYGGRGETLTSISKQYGVSVYSIAAANKNIVDIDLVFQGQKLNIPFSREEIKVTRKNRLPSFDPKGIHRSSLNIFDGLLDKKNFTTQITHSFPHAKTTGYFLVLVPLIAFCIRCMIGAFHTRIAGDSACQAVNESRGRRLGSKNVRWKSALCDIIEGDALDSDSIPDSNDPSEDETQVSFEESSHAYHKLEHDYEKFLSECGMSKWGYWRGGSPE